MNGNSESTWSSHPVFFIEEVDFEQRQSAKEKLHSREVVNPICMAKYIIWDWIVK